MDAPRTGPRPGRARRLTFDRLDSRQLLSGLGSPRHLPVVATVHHHSATVDPAELRVITGIVYVHDGSRSERLDLYLPAGVAPATGWPIVLAFPGGGWRWADRKAYGKEVSVLTQNGYAVAGVDYTYATTGGGATWPLPLSDAQAAVRWARRESGRYDLDPNRVVAMGESAGAHLALLLGTYPTGPVVADRPATASTPSGISSRPNAVIDFYGPTDLTTLYNDGKAGARPYLEGFLGGTSASVPGRYAAASPLTYVKAGDPPVLIVQGMRDTTNLPAQSTALDAALTNAGVSHRLIEIPWADHGFGLNLAGRSFVPDIVSFLTTALGPASSARP